MRGFGQSTPMPRDYPWTLDRLIEDFCLLMDHLGIDRFHLVGAKIGGTVARAFAARRPERVKTLTVVGTPPPLRPGAKESVPALVEMFETQGVEHWARQNMGNRLGSAFPPEGFEFWCKFMGRTAAVCMMRSARSRSNAEGPPSSMVRNPNSRSSASITRA